MPPRIKTAEELIDPELEARWAARRADRQAEVLQCVLRRFVEREGPIRLEEIYAALVPRPPDAVREVLATLHEKDLLFLGDDRIELAYPFSGPPTAFTVILPEGRPRYACCAIDALGIAPLLDRTITIRSECHHCRAPILLTATPEGPAADADGIMVWVGQRGEGQRRISASL